MDGKKHSEKRKARVSKVYTTPNGFVFAACGEEMKEYVRETRKAALKARALLVKALKQNGVSVICQ
jgi:hypothetical protein